MEEELLKFDAEGKLIETIRGAKEKRHRGGEGDHMSFGNRSKRKRGIAESSVYS